MKKIQSLFYFSVFLLSLALGSSTGKMIGVGQNNYTADINLDAYISATPITPNLSEPLPSFSVFVVGITDIKEKTTTLESAWWILFNGDETKFSLIPVYPVIENENLSQFQSPHDPILITTKNLVQLGEIEIFSAQNINWDHYIVIDQTALNLIIEATGNETPGAITTETSGLFESAPKTWEDPTSSLLFQTGILQYLCSHGNTFFKPQKMETGLDLFGNRIKSDLDTREVVDFWNKLIRNGFKFDCEFPSQ